MGPHVQVDVEMSFRVTKPGSAAFVVAFAGGAGQEEFAYPAPPRQVAFEHGTRAQVVDLPEGEHVVRYRAQRALGPVEAGRVSTEDLIRYTRPSRYCPSDRMGGLALSRFGGLPDARTQVEAIVRHVGEHLSYVVGAGSPADDAVDTYLAGEGVCRDFAHVCISLCRVIDIPARFVAVYAPGLSPMDFHAVFEAAIDGRWYVFDATGLAPRQSLSRIATGRDAADTAFLSTLGCELDFLGNTVLATAGPSLPEDDGSELIALA
ncbi:transglutaminase-like domain-containing protein [Amycolatopsis azurea]|uniref:Transglutaminase n=1 Tax=Amycolatopsis azurea DSM 43854 TaxID=1238180 RepID=M2NP04_9PSEU|nr:transglutaminase family protein [Amycolatopsis azurea]EMD23909.1 transglutaminase domain protein [Amycolatopsis azurea DSM 43854]OOC04373.1 transglutaminase [Amycolatopsis azurea DSM 43854]